MENPHSEGLVEPIVTSDSTLPEGGVRVHMKERKMLIEAHSTKAIVLKFSEKLEPFREVKSWIQGNWSEGGISSIRDIGHQLYLVTFDHPEAASQILAQGPWRNSVSHDGNYALVGKWRHDLNLQTFRFLSMAIWIDLPGLPVEFQGPANLQGVAKIFGEPRIIQSPLASPDSGLLHPRICVLWDEQQPRVLPDSDILRTTR